MLTIMVLQSMVGEATFKYNIFHIVKPNPEPKDDTHATCQQNTMSLLAAGAKLDCPSDS